MSACPPLTPPICVPSGEIQTGVERQPTGSSNTLDHSAIGASPYSGGGEMVAGSCIAFNHSAIRAGTHGERRRAVSGKTLDHLDIRAGPGSGKRA